jgi:hypothetical protein
MLTYGVQTGGAFPVTALGATADVQARHLLATWALDKHLKKVSGSTNWLTIETERVDRHPTGENKGQTKAE